jgi:GntR family transcriptional regulator/MocR family aminotransferase
MLSKSLKLARNTVVTVFDQLIAEGYLEAQAGSGTRVSSDLIESPSNLSANSSMQTVARQNIELPGSERYVHAARSLAPQRPVPFAIAVPEAGVAPDKNWRRLANRLRASGVSSPSGYGDPMGVPELRAAIAAHLRRTRAVDCTAENVLVTSGTQQGLYITARILLSAGDTVWHENPAYQGLTAVLEDQRIKSHRIPVDDHGINVAAALATCPSARAAFVTPSHQYPLGMPLSMARRQALVAWADQNASWIIEDDYDSELRYSGHPFPAMQGMNPFRVVYLGTFSKVLFPSLRLGYVVAPVHLIEALAGARAILDRHSPTADQHLLAAFMQEGHLEAHIRRIRILYAERRALLLNTLQSALPKGCKIQPSAQGMHLLVWLPKLSNDIEISIRAAEDGLEVRPISPMYAGIPRKSGLMLGFGGFSPELLSASASILVARLNAALGELK